MKSKRSPNDCIYGKKGNKSQQQIKDRSEFKKIDQDQPKFTASQRFQKEFHKENVQKLPSQEIYNEYPIVTLMEV